MCGFLRFLKIYDDLNYGCLRLSSTQRRALLSTASASSAFQTRGSPQSFAVYTSGSLARARPALEWLPECPVQELSAARVSITSIPQVFFGSTQYGRSLVSPEVGQDGGGKRPRDLPICPGCGSCSVRASTSYGGALARPCSSHSSSSMPRRRRARSATELRGRLRTRAPARLARHSGICTQYNTNWTPTVI